MTSSKPDITVRIEGSEAVADYGEFRSLAPVDSVFSIKNAAPHLAWLGDVIIPDGVKLIIPYHGGGGIYIVHETRPRVHHVRWQKEGTRAVGWGRYEYRNVAIAMPYVYLVIFLYRRNEYVMCSSPQCYFKNSPLSGLDDQLSYPALYNCAPPNPAKGVGSIVCTGTMNYGLHKTASNLSKNVAGSVSDAQWVLFESGFNDHYESGGIDSWFSRSVKAVIDPRISSIAAWEQATREDPAFATTVPWLPAPTLRNLLNLPFGASQSESAVVCTANAVADMVRQAPQSRHVYPY